MSFSGVFAIGLTGINAFATSLEAVSNNIANTQTTGFKRLRTDFSDLVTSQLSEGGISGGGVDAVNRQLVTEQGALARTDTATHLAVSGDGFFVVSEAPDIDASSSPFLFTRSGGFSVQTDGTLANEAGLYLQGAPVAEDGSFTLGGLGNLETVNINAVSGLAEATSALTLSGNLDANALSGATLAQNFQIFDENGDARQAALTFVKTGASQWAATAAFTDGAQETIATGGLVFDANGLVDQGASSFPASLAIAANAGQAVDLDFGALTQLAQATQITAASTNGSAFGALTGVEISRDGRVTALFANGLTRDIYQLALATFVNAEGLENGKSSTFLPASAAGALSLDIPQTGHAGAIESRALEISTVDIGQEFSTLIETQRAYSANTRIITVADELWRTLTQTAA